MLMCCVFSIFGLASGLLYDPRECKKSREGAEYMGTVATTSLGLECQRWDSQEPHTHSFTDPKLYPDADLDAVSNYCRNPDLDTGPWCYTTDQDTRYEFCNVQYCPVYPECDDSYRPGGVYAGSQHVTGSGQECRHWSDMTEGQVDDLSTLDFTFLEENYCRNPSGTSERPWCYVGEGEDDWQYCVISVCKPSASCLTSPSGTEYVGKRGITASGRPCQRWDRQFPHTHGYTDPVMFPDESVSEAENFCRNPDNERNGVWCYTTDPDQEWEYCDIPVCADCTQTVDGQGYAGTVAVSRSGATCKAWSSHSDTVDVDQFPDVSVEAASNYCRNPDGKTGGVWCDIGDTDSEWEHCDLAVCTEDCGKDSKERRTIKHILQIGMDGLHSTCWQNAPGGAPNFRRLEASGAYSYSARCEIITLSAPNWSAQLCGMGNEETGVVSNDWEAPWMGKDEDITPVTGLNYPMPCVFYYLKGMDANIRVASFVYWAGIYELSGRGSPGSTDWDFYCRGTSSSGEACDWDVTGNASEYMAQITQVSPMSYTFIHLNNLDGTGHESGWCGEEYLAAVDVMDEQLGVILDSIEGQDVLVVLGSDHGGVGTGHGGQSDEELLIPLFFSGPGVKQNYQIQGQGRNRDIVPTIAWAMGQPQSPYWYGDVLYEVFEDNQTS